VARTLQEYGQSRPVLETTASARFHGGGKGNASPETGSMLPTATGWPCTWVSFTLLFCPQKIFFYHCRLK